MTPRTLAPALLLALSAVRSAAAQSYGIGRCHPSPEGIGAVSAEGAVRYTLDAQGIPDTGSVSVLGAARISVAGYRSAVVRLLSGCRMQHGDTPVAVTQGIRFDAGGAHLTPALPATGTESALAITAPAPVTGPLDARDSIIEERPSWITCDRPPRTRPVTASGPSAVADQNMFASASSANSGTITAALLIGSDGRVVKDSLKLVSTTNPANSSNLMRSLASCRFAPARIGGIPITTRVAASITVGETRYGVTLGPVSAVLDGR